MDALKIRDMMIPVAEYATVDEGETLADAFMALAAYNRKQAQGKVHHDMLVTRKGVVVTKLAMLDVFKALEPKYKHVLPERYRSRVLSLDIVDKLIHDFALWTDPGDTLCEKAALCKVLDITHPPEPTEYVEEDDPMEQAVHRYILGVHQPLLVRRDGSVTGVLRMGDVFDFLGIKMTECTLK